MITDEMVRVAAVGARRAHLKHLGYLEPGTIDVLAEELTAADLLNARAGLTAAAPLIRAEALREAAAVAQAEESHLRAESFRAKEKPDVFPGLARERELQAVTAMEIMLAILALNETETT